MSNERGTHAATFRRLLGVWAVTVVLHMTPATPSSSWSVWGGGRQVFGTVTPAKLNPPPHSYPSRQSSAVVQVAKHSPATVAPIVRTQAPPAPHSASTMHVAVQ